MPAPAASAMPSGSSKGKKSVALPKSKASKGSKPAVAAGGREVGPAKRSMSTKAGLTLPVARIGALLKKGKYSRRVSGGAGIFLTSVLEYLLAEMLDMASVAAQNKKKQRVTPSHILMAIKEDDEFMQLLGNVTISQASVPPFIMPQLLGTTKKTKSSTTKNTRGGGSSDMDHEDEEEEEDEEEDEVEEEEEEEVDDDYEGAEGRKATGKSSAVSKKGASTAKGKRAVGSKGKAALPATAGKSNKGSMNNKGGPAASTRPPSENDSEMGEEDAQGDDSMGENEENAEDDHDDDNDLEEEEEEEEGPSSTNAATTEGRQQPGTNANQGRGKQAGTSRGLSQRGNRAMNNESQEL